MHRCETLASGPPILERETRDPLFWTKISGKLHIGTALYCTKPWQGSYYRPVSQVAKEIYLVWRWGVNVDRSSLLSPTWRNRKRIRSFERGDWLRSEKSVYYTQLTRSALKANITCGTCRGRWYRSAIKEVTLITLSSPIAFFLISLLILTAVLMLNVLLGYTA